jgi:hypothetical protein
MLAGGRTETRARARARAGLTGARLIGARRAQGSGELAAVRVPVIGGFGHRAGEHLIHASAYWSARPSNLLPVICSGAA